MKIEKNKVHNMDCLEGMKEIESDSVDLVVTDPPYGLSFMGKDWDKAVPTVSVWRQCLRVLKPGAFAFVMSSPRLDCLGEMSRRMQEAGFLLGFSPIFWAYASGFPKAMNISKAVDKRNARGVKEYEALAKYLKKKRIEKNLSTIQVGEYFKTSPERINHGGCVTNWEKAYNVPTKEQWKILRELLELDDSFDELIDRIEAEREVIGKKQTGDPVNWYANQDTEPRNGLVDITLSSTPQAKSLDGSYAGFQPKPAVEVVIVAMKPLSEKGFTEQALKNRKGVSWLDDCRIPFNKDDSIVAKNPHTQSKGTEAYDSNCYGKYEAMPEPYVASSLHGRFPANLLVSDGCIDDGEERKSGSGDKSPRKHYDNLILGGGLGYSENPSVGGDSGSFSRFFDIDKWFDEKALRTFPFLVVPKASKSEKNSGVEKNFHPTVKPLRLMTYLVTLGSRQKDVVLDPFIGSGTTGIACHITNREFIGFELNKEYCEIAHKRIAHISAQTRLGE